MDSDHRLTLGLDLFLCIIFFMFAIKFIPRPGIQPWKGLTYVDKLNMFMDSGSRLLSFTKKKH